VTAPDWRPHFPFAEVREEQGRALDWICDQFWTGERVVIAELGTGVGKSAIAVALAGWIDQANIGLELSPGATVLTSQKVLQDQYVRDFKHARDLRSAANFQCDGPVAGTCGETSRVRKAVGMDLAQQNLKCSACPYRMCKDDFVESKLGITNYSYFLSESTYAGELPARRLLVLDEAHNVEDEVRRWASVEVAEADAKELKLALPTVQSAVAWLGQEYRANLQAKLGTSAKRLKKIVKTGEYGATVRDLANSNDRFDKRLCQVNRILDKGGEVLVSESTDRKGKRSLRFQPVDVTNMVQDALYSRAARVLLTSATLLDREVYSRSVGAVGAPYLSIPTTFPKEAFGITVKPVGRMGRSQIETSITRLPKAIKGVLANHPNEKGIIHTVNYRVAKAIADNVRDPRLLIQSTSSDRDAMLRKHLTSPEPTVLVSPSMMEGLDLRDELGRFQVVCKVPFPDFSDPLVARKDRSWYDWRTVRSLVQAVGRGVRSNTDWCKTYMLDLSFVDLLERCGHMFPEHLRKGLEVEDL
jgi:ATP-dependent DNA helicase DinG